MKLLSRTLAALAVRHPQVTFTSLVATLSPHPSSPLPTSMMMMTCMMTGMTRMKMMLVTMMWEMTCESVF